jgi:hypothetical protein
MTRAHRLTGEAIRPGRGHTLSSTTPSTASSATGPRWRESTPSSGLSLSSHQPGAPDRVGLGECTRFTATVPSGNRATTTSPGRGRRR